MTVCIAAACRNGQFVVSATDGALTSNGQTADLSHTKMYWMVSGKDMWQFMYAGEPGNADLILENIRQRVNTDAHALSREKIQQTLRRAYKQRFAEWTADYILAPYDLTMEEFRKEGKQMFGDEFAADLARQMNSAASEFREEIMVVGWGKTPIAVMIYGMNQSGAFSGSLTGLGAIGAGREVAMQTLLLHGITRNSSLEDTLYGVAAAKFSSERCDGVGRNTTIRVIHKRGDTDDDQVPDFLTRQEVLGLRRVWMQHGRMRIPDQAYPRVASIAQRVSGSVGLESLPRLMRSASRKSKGRR